MPREELTNLALASVSPIVFPPFVSSFTVLLNAESDQSSPSREKRRQREQRTHMMISSPALSFRLFPSSRALSPRRFLRLLPRLPCQPFRCIPFDTSIRPFSLTRENDSRNLNREYLGSGPRKEEGFVTLVRTCCSRRSRVSTERMVTVVRRMRMSASRVEGGSRRSRMRLID